MTSNNTKAKINEPAQLPSKGMTAIGYKQWKLALKLFLFQTPAFREFYPGGRYTTWSSYEKDPNRIKQLANSDKLETAAQNPEHLAQRQIDLETFLGIIAKYSDEGDFDDILEKSTSLEFIFKLHERRYNLQKKGRYLLRFDTIRFDSSYESDHYKFYTNLRSCFKENLRKAGDKLKYNDGEELTENEIITPTTESLLIQIALERIDSRLPSEIDRIFGHRMDDSTCLIDLKDEIFAYIPRALATLDKDEQISCNANIIQEQLQLDSPQPIQHQYDDQHQLNALYGRNGAVFRQQLPRPRIRPDPPRHQFQYRPNASQNRFQPPPNRYPATNKPQKYCKICQALGLPQGIVTSHYPNDCYRRNALLNQEMTLYEHDETSYNEPLSYVPEDYPLQQD